MGCVSVTYADMYGIDTKRRTNQSQMCRGSARRDSMRATDTYLGSTCHSGSMTTFTQR